MHRMNSIEGLATALFAGLLAMAPAHAEPVTVRVAPQTTLIALNPELTASYNFGNWMQMAEFGEQMGREVPPASLRFPGGNIGDEYDLSGYGFDVLVANLALIKSPKPPKLMVQTRVFQAKPSEAPARNRAEDAGEAVRLARERGLQVKYWEVGNEPDLYAVTRGDPSWTPERYCEVFRSHALAIKAADPQAIVAGPAVSGAVPAATEFTERFVRGCGDVIDMLTWHIYPTAGDQPEAQALASVEQVDALTRHYREMWADPARNPLGHQRQIQYGVTEFGLSWKTDNPILLADMPAAMWAAETALRLARGGLSVAHYFAYQGVGFHGLLDLSGTPRPTFYAFRMMRGLRGDLVETQSSDTTVWAHATRQGQRLNVLVSNTGHAAQTLQLDVPGWRVASAQQFDNDTVEHDAPPKRLKPGAALQLAPQSMSLVSLVPAKPARRNIKASASSQP